PSQPPVDGQRNEPAVLFTITATCITAGCPPVRSPIEVPFPTPKVQLRPARMTVTSNPLAVTVPLSVPAIQWISSSPPLTVSVLLVQPAPTGPQVRLALVTSPTGVVVALPVFAPFLTALAVATVHVASSDPVVLRRATVPPAATLASSVST